METLLLFIKTIINDPIEHQLIQSIRLTCVNNYKMITKEISPNEKGDWNHDIYIRDIEEEDFYNGITVQSYGNTNCIYELRFIDNKW